MDLAPGMAPIPQSLETQMANRNQDYYPQSGSRAQSRDWRDDEDNSYDEGRMQYGRSRERNTDEQSGSTGRYAGYGDFGRGEYGGGRSGWSGQERYGQSGYGQGGYSSQGGGGRGDYGRGGYEQGDYRSSGQGSSGARGYGVGYGGRDMNRERYGQANYRSDYGYGGSQGYG